MKRLFILSSLVFVSGCLTTRTQLRENQPAKSGAVLIEQGTATEASSEVAPKVIDPSTPQGQAQIEMRMQEYDETMRQMKGRIEALEFNLTKSRAETQSEEKKNEESNDKLKMYEEALVRMQNEIDELKKQKDSIATKKDNQENAKLEPKTKEDKATQYYREADSFFSEKDWKKAIINYQKYRDTLPKGRMYAMATYKIGVCFQELGLNSEAKTFYKEVMDKFPGTKEYKKASYRNSRLK